jgi:hypothetical protein
VKVCELKGLVINQDDNGWPLELLRDENVSRCRLTCCADQRIREIETRDLRLGERFFGSAATTGVICYFVVICKYPIFVSWVDAARDLAVRVGVIRVGAHTLSVTQQLSEMSACAQD